MDLPFVTFSYKWNHSIYIPCYWLLSLSIALSNSIYTAALSVLNTSPFSVMSTLCNSMDSSLPGCSVCEIFPSKSTAMGFYSLLQGIFLTQELNLCLLCPALKADSLLLSHFILYPFVSGLWVASLFGCYGHPCASFCVDMCLQLGGIYLGIEMLGRPVLSIEPLEKFSKIVTSLSVIICSQ